MSCKMGFKIFSSTHGYLIFLLTEKMSFPMLIPLAAADTVSKICLPHCTSTRLSHCFLCFLPCANTTTLS